MTEISTHVLDTAGGIPAAGTPVTLESRTDEDWTAVATSRTDADGRASLGDVRAGAHRLVFQLAAGAFFPEVTVTFAVADEPRLHLPLLLGPYSYTTYRGS